MTADLHIRSVLSCQAKIATRALALGVGGLSLVASVNGESLGTLGAEPETYVTPSSATVIVAAADSSKRARETADFVGDGVGDQEEINAAIRALPPAGGTVMLMSGTYDIRKIPGKLGGVLIERSYVTLAGQGASTKLKLAPDQNVNVIRIIGSGIGFVTIRDLYVDANRAQNSAGIGDPNVSHGRFEFCGIKAYYREPGGEWGDDLHDITIRNCHVHNSHRLGVMLEGPNMRVLNNVLGNAGSDAVEILTGPGEIRGNFVVITGYTHVAVGSDRANSMIMSDNIVHVKKGGRLDIGFRSWAGSKRHAIGDNVLTVDPGGSCTLAMDIRGTGATVTGNVLHGPDGGVRPRLRIAGGSTIASANILESVDIEIDDETGATRPIVVKDNLFESGGIIYKTGKLITE
jgi:hypothetical protein